MKKLFVILIAILTIYLIFTNIPSRHGIIWKCPKGEEISHIRTSDEPGKLFVVTEKGGSWILRAVYGPDKADVLLTVPGKVPKWNHIIQGYDPDEFLISSSTDNRGLYIRNLRTGSDTEIRGVKCVISPTMFQPFSPDGKWIALNTVTSVKGAYFGISIVNRKSGRVTPLGGIDASHSNYISWTRNGLMIFNDESGILYKGDESGVKPIKRAGQSRLGYVTPDGNELITLSDGVTLTGYDLRSSDFKVIYAKKIKHDKDERCLMFIWLALEHSPFSNEMIISMNYPPVEPIYVGQDRVCREIPIGPSKRLWDQVSIWKPGTIAYVEDNGKKHPNVILSVKMK